MQRIQGTGALLSCAMIVGQFFSPEGHAQGEAGRGPERHFVVEYYYKARWGCADEFIRLFTRNHYPVLRKQIDMGRIIDVKVEKPRYHNTEDGRWDYRVTIVFKDSRVANDDFDEGTIAKTLFPDQETFRREEERRFEILLAHWDVPIVPVNLDAK